MKIISTNVAQPRTVLWNGRPIQTGIFKYPVHPPIRLGLEDVVGDHVIDRRFHGGLDKACYLYSADHYPFWRGQYPDLEWDFGMFGENLTVEGLDESTLRIGDVYRIGSALVQVSQPRQPCFKLGIRFGDPGMVKAFIQEAKPGTYVRVLEKGEVDEGMDMELVERNEEAITIRDLYRLLYNRHPDPVLLEKTLGTPGLAESAVASLQKRLAMVKN